VITLTERKKPCLMVVVPAPKVRGIMPPPTRVRQGRGKDHCRGNRRSRRWA
jgi:hypothetical protein